MFFSTILGYNKAMPSNDAGQQQRKAMQYTYTPEQKAEAANMIAINERQIKRMKTKTGRERGIAYLEDMNNRLKNETFKIV